MMKRFIFFLIIVTIAPMFVQARLSRNAVISLVTYDPSDEAVFTVFGHTALHVSDPELGFDYVFNYGMFDFNSPAFLYRFTKGETDYKLVVTDYNYLIFECTARGCGARELVLNLNDEEKNRIFDALLLNARPENATYRYNFFFDNCATRPAAIVEKNITGNIVYANQTEKHTFRQLINHCMRKNSWMIFGTELVLGSPADLTATLHEEFFLPLYLEAAFENAVIINHDGSERRLVVSKNVLLEPIPTDEESAEVFTPLLCSCVLAVIILLIMILEWRRHKYYRLLDGLLLFIYGMAGCIIFFLAFISVHPATWPNWNILWLHPFHLIGALIIVAGWKKATLVYCCLNILILTAFLLASTVMTQQFNAAFMPLIAILLLRSAGNIYHSRFSQRAPSR